MEVAYGKQLSFPFFQPAHRVVGVAFGTASVFAGMVRVMLIAAHFAFADVSAHAFRATGNNVLKRPFVTWQHPVAEFIQILSAMFGYDIGKFDHSDKSAIR